VICRSLQEGTVPRAWKTANVIPVPKVVGGINPCDYRPISITSVVAKVTERFVLEQLQPSIDERLPSFQYGFRAGRSTTDALVDAEHNTMQAMDECRRRR
jgi:hypothetical protein